MLNSTTYAGVAELADALASGASELRLVKVQVLSPAPAKKGNGYRKVAIFVLLVRANLGEAQEAQALDLNRRRFTALLG